MSRHTLYLDDRWDITLTDSGGIATTTGAYAIAQDVANAVRLFTDDAYFDTDRGIPHFDIDLGVRPAMSVVRARMREAALGVEGVETATPNIAPPDADTRKLTGTIELTTDTGETVTVAV